MGVGSPCVHEVSRATKRGTRFPSKSLPASGTIHGLEFAIEFDLSLQCGKHSSAWRTVTQGPALSRCSLSQHC